MAGRGRQDVAVTGAVTVGDDALRRFFGGAAFFDGAARRFFGGMRSVIAREDG